MTKHMILRVKDDAYFYKILGEKNRIAEMLYEIRETVNKNFKQYPFVKDIGYFLNKNEITYEYVVTIAYETDEPDTLVEKTKTFTANVRKMDYENYDDEVFEANRKLIERKIYGEVDKFFGNHPDYKITKKEAEWTETDESDIFTIVVTYTAPYNAEQEKVTPTVQDETLVIG